MIQSAIFRTVSKFKCIDFNKEQNKNKSNFYTHARPSAQTPIDMIGKILPHMSANLPSNISSNPQKVISKVLEP